MSTIEERRAKRDAQREADEKRLADEEKERLARPLVERLRDCGPFRAGDGHMSIAVGNYRDAHEAADRIEKLERILKELNLAPCGHNYNAFSSKVCAKPGCPWRNEE
jgi:uncharacterized protein YciI